MTRPIDGPATAWPAPAKINLFLHVTGRRPDGYHELQTLFQLLDWGDEIQLRVTGDSGIGRSAAGYPVAEDRDLAVRAACLLQSATACRQGVEIRVRKRIPLTFLGRRQVVRWARPGRAASPTARCRSRSRRTCAGQDVFVIQPTCAPTAENFMELLVLIDALKRASAASVTAVVPYFGYARQDRRPRSARVPITAKVAAKMFPRSAPTAC
jgi:hypothetical protein